MNDYVSSLDVAFLVDRVLRFLLVTFERLSFESTTPRRVSADSVVSLDDESDLDSSLVKV